MKTSLIVLLIIFIGFTFVDSYSETVTLLSQSVINRVYVQPNEPRPQSTEISSYYLLAGERNNQTYFAQISVNTNDVPKSDPWNDVVVDSVKIKLLAVLVNGTSDKYYLTANVCTNEYDELLDSRWLHGESKAQPYTTHGGLQTPDCNRLSPSDSVVVNRSELPKIYELDVTNITRELIELNSLGITYIITARPIDISIPDDYTKTPINELDGLVAIAPKVVPDKYGSNVIATASITYTITPNQFAKNLNTAVTVAAPVIAGSAIPIIIFILEQKNVRNKSSSEQKDILKRAVQSISHEINIVKHVLQGQRAEYQIIEYYTSGQPSESIKYVNGFLDDDAYNSIIMSGQFDHLKIETQYVLREIYSRIKDHNETIKYTNSIEDKISLSSTNQADVLTRYDLHLTMLDSKILSLIPHMQENLEKELE